MSTSLTTQLSRSGQFESLTINRVDVFVYRFPVETPVATSFGLMRNRPAVFVRLEDDKHNFGWGEIFANWPVAGAEHRANLLMEDIADLVLGTRLDGPADLFYKLKRETRIRALQCGEWGPFNQVIAGLDIAVWDLFARRKGVPMVKLLNNDGRDCVPAYASGIHISKADEMIKASRQIGFSAYKVKIGFDFESDIDGVKAQARQLLSDERLMTDANQAWSFDQASKFVRHVADFNIGWLEEPIPVDSPMEDWKKLAENSPIPIAGGENIMSRKDFETAIEAGALSIIQPDIAKWGGFTGCLAVAKEAMAADRIFCPHFLGGGLGLIASAHLLAAVGGEGCLEVDVNPNPLRDLLASSEGAMHEGLWHLSNQPGLGVEELPQDFLPLQTHAASKKL